MFKLYDKKAVISAVTPMKCENLSNISSTMRF